MSDFISNIRAAGPVDKYTEVVRVANADEIGNAVRVDALPAPSLTLSGLIYYLTTDGKFYAVNLAGDDWVEISGGGGGAVSSVFGRTGAVVAAQDDYSASQIANDSLVSGADVGEALSTLQGLIPPVAPVDSVNGRTGEVTGLAESGQTYLYADYYCTSFVGGAVGALDAISAASMAYGQRALVRTALGDALYVAVTTRTTNPLAELEIVSGTGIYAAVKPDNATGSTAHYRWELWQTGSRMRNVRTEQFGGNDIGGAHTWTSGDHQYRYAHNYTGAGTALQTANLWNNDYGKLWLNSNNLQKGTAPSGAWDLMHFESRQTVPVCHTLGLGNVGASSSDTNVLTGGTASASSYYGTLVPANAVDGNTGTIWYADDAWPSWLKYDLGAGVTKTVTRIRIYTKPSNGCLSNFSLEGSNNDSDWTSLGTRAATNTSGWQEFSFSNSTAYRYYRLYITSSHGPAGPDLYEWQAFESSAPSTRVLECPIFAGATAGQTRIYMPKAGSVTGLSLQAGEAVTAGTIVAGLKKNGVTFAAGLDCTLSTSVPLVASRTATPATHTFVAGDYLEIGLTVSADMTPTQPTLVGFLYLVFNS